MTMQNLVSATMSAEEKAEILQMFDTVRAKMPYLMSLNDKQLLSLRKVSRKYRPFVQKAHEAAVAIPEILPPVFPMEEYQKDWELIEALTPILWHAEELVSALRDTLMAANSDAMVESLEVYNAIKSHKNKVPGLDVVHTDLARFFKKSRAKPAHTAPISSH